LKRTYGMLNLCNVRLPQAIGDIISSTGISIGIGTAAANSISYWVSGASMVSV